MRKQIRSLRVDPDLQKLSPPMDPDEYRCLEDSLRQRGVQRGIVVETDLQSPLNKLGVHKLGVSRAVIDRLENPGVQVRTTRKQHGVPVAQNRRQLLRRFRILHHLLPV